MRPGLKVKHVEKTHVPEHPQRRAGVRQEDGRRTQLRTVVGEAWRGGKVGGAAEIMLVRLECRGKMDNMRNEAE